MTVLFCLSFCLPSVWEAFFCCLVQSRPSSDVWLLSFGRFGEMSFGRFGERLMSFGIFGEETRHIDLVTALMEAGYMCLSPFTSFVHVVHVHVCSHDKSTLHACASELFYHLFISSPTYTHSQRDLTDPEGHTHHLSGLPSFQTSIWWFLRVEFVRRVFLLRSSPVGRDRSLLPLLLPAVSV